MQNKIYICDVFEFLEKLPNACIDLAIVDPPYNLKIAKWDSFKNENEFLEFSYKWMELMLLKMKPNGSFYIFNTPYNCALFINFLKDKKLNFNNFITWYKKDGLSYAKTKYVNNQESILFYAMSKKYYFNADEIRIPYESESRIKHAAKKGILKNGKRWYPNEKGKLCPDVWQISSLRHTNKINGKTMKQNHPSPKPKEMIERMIKASSKENDLILDLFAGTGVVSLMAKKLNRNFIGCESNIEYLNKNLRDDLCLKL
ncbi:site-specific DNA-methyltransferase [Campylobacter novaezeelandiae]|uniref:DNA-methyltransferase n=1 Tax=Campylobacter novaezeelandiae TaxID=2267891 RepID=UPI001036F424|nr:site-specific DNA-methyltransferase [Campylobacter novaezeelandiae]QWU80346.1 type IIS restriction/modification system, DNA methyltransferase [Campylobacter novaezeelandiae]TBR80090.1 site-specific DNA-methyltransferase [Campylobacter novaezeelandiae]